MIEILRALASPDRTSILLLALVCIALGCDRRPTSTRQCLAPAKPIELDLLELNANALGRNRSLDLHSGGLGARVTQDASSVLDLFVSSPDEAVLEFRIEPELDPSKYTVELETRDEVRVLEFQAGDGGKRRVELGITGSMRLRFTNRSDVDLSWIDPVIVGCAVDSPSPLPSSALPPAGPINVVLYVVDTLRYDHLSVYGYERPITPNFDALARRGFLFANAYAPGTSTLPSISALFTSRHPSLSKVALRYGKATLASAFADAGYSTVAIQANYLTKVSLGFGRGFDRYFSPRGPEESPFVRAEDLHSRVVKFLQSRPPGPFFLYIQSMDVHGYDPPAPFRALKWDPPSEDGRLSYLGHKMSVDNYDRTIAYTDFQIGKLIDELRKLGLGQNTVILITSDHGEPLSQHGHHLHGTSVYEELVHVPAILILPWHTGGVRVEPIVSLIDFAPTLLALAGVSVPDDFQGRSLFEPYSTGQPATAVGEKTKWLLRNRQHGADEWYLRRGPWKLIMDEKQVRLYHLPTDRGETEDVSTDHPIETAYLASELMARTPVFRSGWAEVPPLDANLSAQEAEELEQALRSLGYAD